MVNPTLNELPRDVLLDIARFLKLADLIAFSQAFGACYRLSQSSISFWSHEITSDVLNKQTDASSSGLYHQAAIQSWRLRKLLRDEDDNKRTPRHTRHVECDGLYIAELIVPQTHILLGLVEGSNGEITLRCVDLLKGAEIGVLGDLPPRAIKLDATVIQNELHVLFVSHKDDDDSPWASEFVYSVYRGRIEARDMNEPTLSLERLFQQTFSHQYRKILRVAIEGDHVVSETVDQRFMNSPSTTVFFLLNWKHPSQSWKNSTWSDEESRYLFSWQVAGEHLFATYFTREEGSSLCAVSLTEIHHKLDDETASASVEVKFPPFLPSPITGFYRIAFDRKGITRSDGVQTFPLVAMGLAEGQRGPSSTRVLDAPVQLHKTKLELQPDETSPELTVKDGFALRFPPSTQHAIVAQSPQYINVARLSNGIFWGLCDARPKIDHGDVRDSHQAHLFVCDLDSGIRSLREIPNIPEGNAHLVDMDVGVVVTLQHIELDEENHTTQLQIDWYV